MPTQFWLGVTIFRPRYPYWPHYFILPVISGFLLGMKMVVIGLTGGIATGKSTVSKILKEEHGFTIIDADQISHDLRKYDKNYQEALIKTFGDQVWDDLN